MHLAARETATVLLVAAADRPAPRDRQSMARQHLHDAAESSLAA
jgi:hypothetical protein